MDTLINIKVSEAKQSPTNTKGRTEGKDFEELVASIKEKGVLQPVLVRGLSGKDKVGKWEVIAGNRRLAAAKEAGLEEIPAKVVLFNDEEALEAQIVENLQRKDVHPIDEGQSYRKLVEEMKLETAVIAAKVGKSETHVRERLYLTNITKKAEDAYRTGKINDGHAVLIAKLGEEDQAKALKFVTDNEFRIPTVRDLKEWVHENVYVQLGNQPWTAGSDKEVEEWKKIVGECKECEPNKASLFGQVKEGNCTNTKCWERKMGKYVEHKAKEGCVKVSDEWATPPKGVYAKGNYTVVFAHGKNKCGNEVDAVVAVGPGAGKTFKVCVTKDCEKHGGGHSSYALTPEEKEKRRKERQKEREKEEKQSSEFIETLEKKSSYQTTPSLVVIDCVTVIVTTSLPSRHTNTSL